MLTGIRLVSSNVSYSLHQLICAFEFSLPRRAPLNFALTRSNNAPCKIVWTLSRQSVSQYVEFVLRNVGTFDLGVFYVECGSGLGPFQVKLFMSISSGEIVLCSLG